MGACRAASMDLKVLGAGALSLTGANSSSSSKTSSSTTGARAVAAAERSKLVVASERPVARATGELLPPISRKQGSLTEICLSCAQAQGNCRPGCKRYTRQSAHARERAHGSSEHDAKRRRKTRLRISASTFEGRVLGRVVVKQGFLKSSRVQESELLAAEWL